MRRSPRHRIGSGGLLACLGALVVLSAAPAVARAAPEYQESYPAAGSSQQTSPDYVSVTFNEPLDETSRLAVTNACGKNVDNGNVTINLNEMSVGLNEAHYSGTYKVGYHAVGIGGVTGATDGSFEFGVVEGHRCADHEGDGGHVDQGHDGHQNGGKGHGGHGDHEGGDDARHAGHDSATHSEHADAGHSAASHASGREHHAPGGSSAHESHEGHAKKGLEDDEHAHHGSPGGTQAAKVLPELPADERAALIALGLAAAMGVIGGLFLRATTH